MIRELEYLAAFEYLEDNEVFRFEGQLYLKWKGKPIPFVTGEDFDVDENKIH